MAIPPEGWYGLPEPELKYETLLTSACRGSYVTAIAVLEGSEKQLIASRAHRCSTLLIRAARDNQKVRPA